MEISKKATKALNRWCEDEFYVYLRPITSRFLRPDDTSIYWNVMVEFRNVGWKRWHAAGNDLDKVLLKLAEEIPHRTELDKHFEPGLSRPKGQHAPAGPLGHNDHTRPMSIDEVVFWVDNNVPPPDIDPQKQSKKNKKSKAKKKNGKKK